MLELGCGSGFATAAILRRRSALHLTGVDSDGVSLAQGRINLRPWRGKITLVRADLAEFLASRPAASYDCVATKFVLHNLDRGQRSKVLRHVFRVLKPGGFLVNADKVVRQGRAHRGALEKQLKDYVDFFVPIGRLDLLRHILNHYFHDLEEARVLRERDHLAELRRIGFRAVRRLRRWGMDAAVRAEK